MIVEQFRRQLGHVDYRLLMCALIGHVGTTCYRCYCIWNDL